MSPVQTTNATCRAAAESKMCFGVLGCESAADAGRLSPATMKLNVSDGAAPSVPVPGMGDIDDRGAVVVLIAKLRNVTNVTAANATARESRRVMGRRVREDRYYTIISACAHRPRLTLS